MTGPDCAVVCILIKYDQDYLDNGKEANGEAQGTSRESFESGIECLGRQGRIARLCAL